MKRTLYLALIFLILFPISCLANNSKIKVVYFYLNNCLSCRENEEFIQELDLNKDLNLITYNVESLNYQDVQLKYAKAYNMPEKDRPIVPTMYIGDKYFIIHDEAERDLIRIAIEEYVSGEKEYLEIKINFKELLEDKTYPDILRIASFGGLLIVALLACALGFYLSSNP